MATLSVGTSWMDGRPGILRREQISAAKQDRSHVAIAAFDTVGMDHWFQLDRVVRSVSNADMYYDVLGDHLNRVCVEAFEPFADRLERVDFELGPLDIVSIWSKAAGVFSQKDMDARNPSAFSYPMYHMAAALACCYGTAQFPSDRWDHLYREAGHTSFSIARYPYDRNDSYELRFRDSMHEIKGALSDLEFFRFGTRTDMVTLIGNAFREGTPGPATEELRAATEWSDTHDDPLLASIHEHWDKALRWIC